MPRSDLNCPTFYGCGISKAACAHIRSFLSITDPRYPTGSAIGTHFSIFTVNPRFFSLSRTQQGLLKAFLVQQVTSMSPRDAAANQIHCKILSVICCKMLGPLATPKSNLVYLSKPLCLFTKTIYELSSSERTCA